MGFEQLAFSFAHLGLLIYIHYQPNGFGSCFGSVVVVSHILTIGQHSAAIVGGAVYAIIM